MPAYPSNEDLFLASLYALAKNDADAVKYIKRQAHREWKEIDQFATREALSSLPNTVEELIDELEGHDGFDITDIAEFLGATNQCAICGTTIVRPYVFAEAMIEHYGLSDPKATEAFQRIEQAILSSGIETGGWDDSLHCAYHSNRADKDD